MAFAAARMIKEKKVILRNQFQRGEKGAKEHPCLL